MTGAQRSAERSGSGRFVPDCGDLVWLSFDPQAGSEQAGRRPALVLTPASYNGRAGLAVCCPVTSHTKGYPFEVPVPAGAPIAGVVLVDQIRSLDWTARRATRIASAPAELMHEVRAKLAPLLGL